VHYCCVGGFSSDIELYRQKSKNKGYVGIFFSSGIDYRHGFRNSPYQNICLEKNNKLGGNIL